MNVETPDSQKPLGFFKQHNEGVFLVAFLLLGTLGEYGNRFEVYLSSAGKTVFFLIFAAMVLFAKIKLQGGIIISVLIGFLGAWVFLLFSATVLIGLVKFLFEIDLPPNPMSSYDY